MAYWESVSERWVKHYSSFHRILLVGEGDFSFALSLAFSFGSASNIVATSLDSKEDVLRKYKNGNRNLQELRRLGATLIFRMDATKMKYDIPNCRFHRIVYNFPHAGFHRKEDNPLLIQMHRVLVAGFFHNAAKMLQPGGEVHVSHKTSKPFCDWNIEKLAFINFLKLLDCSNFNIEDYPGYSNKRGDGFKADDPFPLGECCTYKFVLDPVMNQNSVDMIQRNLRLELSSHGPELSTSNGVCFPRPRNNVSELGCLRFNICGFSRGDPGLAGCAAGLIDEDGVYRFMFSAPLGFLEYEVVELSAFEAALRWLLRSNLIGKKYVLIRSHSFEVVSWITNPRFRPMHLLKHFTEIDSMLNMDFGVRIQLISREDNRFAEIYAMKAVLFPRAITTEL